jgi:hypothetical protein
MFWKKLNFHSPGDDGLMDFHTIIVWGWGVVTSLERL